MRRISELGTTVLKSVLVTVCLAMGVLWPEWRVGLQAQNYDRCQSHNDCRSGETCTYVKVTPPPPCPPACDGRGICSPAGCQSDSDCLAGEICRSAGAGIENQCVPGPDTGSDQGTSIPASTPSQPPPPVVVMPRKPGEPPAPPPPAPQTPRPPQTKPVTYQFNIVVLGTVDLRQLAQAKARLEHQLQGIFGDRFKVELKFGLESKPSRESNVYTMYIAAGDTPPTTADGKSLWELHGLQGPSKGSADELNKVFDPSEATFGATVGRVSIISSEKAFLPTFSPNDYGSSNVIIHEFGHALVGRGTCYQHPDVPECKGVMLATVPRSQELGYTPEFIERAKILNPLLVAEAPRYTAVWQQSTEDEIQLYNWTIANLSAKYEELRQQGWRLNLLSSYVLDGAIRHVAVFRPSTEDEMLLLNRSYADYRRTYDRLWGDGWRLKLLNVYAVNDQVRYTAVWQPGTEAETQLYDQPYEVYRAEYDKLWGDGWRLKLLNVYAVNDQVRYTAVWQPGTEAEIQLYGWRPDSLRDEYDELRPLGWRLKLLSPYVLNGEVRYVAVFQPSEQAEFEVYGWPYEEYRAEYDKLWEEGWRLKLLSPF